MPNSQPTPMITMDQDGQYCEMSAEDWIRIGGVPTVRKRISVSDQEHGYDVQEVDEPLATRADCPEPSAECDHSSTYVGTRNRFTDALRIPNAGLKEFVAYLAERHGYQLDVRRSIPASSLLPSAERPPWLTYPDVVDFVQQHESGLVQISGDSAIPQILSDLARAFPTIRIVLLANLTALTRAFQALQRSFPPTAPTEQQLTLVHDGSTPIRHDGQVIPGIILCTPAGAAEIDLEKADVVLLWDAYQAMHLAFEWPLIQIDSRFRLFGFWRNTRKPTDYELARLRTVYGFQQLVLWQPGWYRRETHVAYCRSVFPSQLAAPSSDAVPGQVTGARTLNSMTAYIHNHVRNEQIRRLATKLSRGSAPVHPRYRDVRRWISNHASDRFAISIVVDRPEHAIMLARRLPDWSVIIDRECNLSDVSRRLRRRIQRDQQHGSLLRIIDADTARTIRDCDSDIVIWAGGGTSVDLPDSWLHSCCETRRPLLIIDFQDDYSRLARRYTRKRQEGLIERDIYSVGTSPVMGRLQRFEQIVGGQR